MPLENSGSADSAEPGAAELLPRDRLEYVADLLAELQTIVIPAACGTLSGLLALSEAEARRLAIQTRT